MTDSFLLQCPEADSAELEDLLSALIADEAIGESEKPLPVRVHPFDGQVLLETLLPLTTAVLTVVRTWIRARYDLKKSTFIMKDGDVIITRGIDPDKGIEILRSQIQEIE